MIEVGRGDIRNGEAGDHLKAGDCGSTMCSAEQEFGRALRRDGGRARFKCRVVRVLSSSGPQVADVPLILVSRWSPYPSIQTWGFGRSRPIPRAFPLHLITSVLGSEPLDITVMVDVDSIWIVQKCPKSLLYTAAQPGN